MVEYVSADERFFRPLGKMTADFVTEAIKGAYGTFATGFRIPTFVRRMYLEQDLFSKSKYGQDKEKGGSSISAWFGGATGVISGAIPSFIAGEYVVDQTASGNPIPLLTVIGTNLASGIYEIRKDARKRNAQRESKLKRD